MTQEKDPCNNKNTFIERMFDRFFNAQATDVKGFLLVVVVLYAVWITRLYVNQNKVFSDRLVEEVRKQVQPAVQEIKRDQQPKIDEMQRTVNETKSQVDTLAAKANNILDNISQTVNDIKK